MPEVREELIKIFGRSGDEIHRICIEITEIADKLDWAVPIEHKANMMQSTPAGLSGAVSVDFSDDEDEDEDIEEYVEDEDNDEPSEFNIDNILSDIESHKEEAKEILDNTNKPVIMSRGIDFVMLVHETIKGIYQLLSYRGIPSDADIAQKVVSSTESYLDEAENFRYGPEIASDLRDFINQNSKVEKYKGIREYVFGEMMEIPANEFLILMRGILSKTADARRKIDDIIDGIISSLDKFELGEVIGHDNDDDYNDNDDEEGLEDFDVAEPEEDKRDSELDKIRNKKLEYSSMSQSQLQIELDNAIDEGDYTKAKEISKYLK